MDELRVPHPEHRRDPSQTPRLLLRLAPRVQSGVTDTVTPERVSNSTFHRDIAHRHSDAIGDHRDAHCLLSDAGEINGVRPGAVGDDFCGAINRHRNRGRTGPTGLARQRQVLDGELDLGCAIRITPAAS